VRRFGEFHREAARVARIRASGGGLLEEAAGRKRRVCAPDAVFLEEIVEDDAV